MRADNTRKTRQTTADGAASFLLREIIFINRVAERWWRIFEYLLSKIRRTVSKFTRPISRPGNIARKKNITKYLRYFLEKKDFGSKKRFRENSKMLENGRRREKSFFLLKTTISNWYWKNLYSRSRNEWKKKKKKKKVYGILREELI